MSGLHVTQAGWCKDIFWEGERDPGGGVTAWFQSDILIFEL